MRTLALVLLLLSSATARAERYVLPWNAKAAAQIETQRMQTPQPVVVVGSAGIERLPVVEQAAPAQQNAPAQPAQPAAKAEADANGLLATVLGELSKLDVGELRDDDGWDWRDIALTGVSAVLAIGLTLLGVPVVLRRPIQSGIMGLAEQLLGKVDENTRETTKAREAAEGAKATAEAGVRELQANTAVTNAVASGLQQNSADTAEIKKEVIATKQN